MPAVLAGAGVVGPETAMAHTARLMNSRHVRRLPVVEAEGRLIGIVSRRHLLSPVLCPDGCNAAAGPSLASPYY